MSRSRLVVVGNGMAGARLVEELVNRGAHRQREIVIFGDEPHGNYNRILLSGVLAGTRRADDIVINPLAWYAANDIDLRAGVRVTAIDPRTRSLTTASGGVEHYDSLVFATGSRPLLPPIEGLFSSDAGAPVLIDSPHPAHRNVIATSGAFMAASLRPSAWPNSGPNVLDGSGFALR